MEEKFVEAGGNRLRAIVSGAEDGKWLTCLHGLAANLTLWDRTAEEFGDEFRVLRIDMRGHGQSTAETPASSLDDLVADVAAVWDALGIRRSHVLGLSLGGMTGIGVALAHPDRVEKLVAADCRSDSPEFFASMWRSRQELLREKGMEAILEVTLPIWYAEGTRRDRPDLIEVARGMILGTSQPGYFGATEALRQLDLKRRLPGLTTPTLFICGALDGPHPQEMQAMAALTPGARYVEIPDAAHMSALEQPARFNAAAAEFLRG